MKTENMSRYCREYPEMYGLSKIGCVVKMVKSPPASADRGKRHRFHLDWEDPLEEGTATHSSIFAWRIPWTEEPSRL